MTAVLSNWHRAVLKFYEEREARMSGPYTKVWRVGNTLSDGGAILSVKHDGSFGTMPIGSVGQAELFGENGLIAAYSPDGHTVFEFRFLKTWPGDPDACGICLKAL